jgi:hypothetical protein
VLRGGSWNNNRDNARCAYRNDNNPDNDNDNNGFRLATRAPRPPEMRRDALSNQGGTAPRCSRRTTGRFRVRPERAKHYPRRSPW